MDPTSTVQHPKRPRPVSSPEPDTSKRQRTGDDEAPHLPFDNGTPTRAFFQGVSESVRWIFEVSCCSLLMSSETKKLTTSGGGGKTVQLAEAQYVVCAAGDVKDRPEAAALVSEDWVWSSWATGRLMEPTEFPVPPGPMQEAEIFPPTPLAVANANEFSQDERAANKSVFSEKNDLASSAESSASPWTTYLPSPTSTSERSEDVHLPDSVPAPHREGVISVIHALRKWNKCGSLNDFLRSTGVKSAASLYGQHRQIIQDNVRDLSERVYERVSVPPEGSDNEEDPVPLPETIQQRHRRRLRAVVRALRDWDGRGAVGDFLKQLQIPLVETLYNQHRQLIGELVPGLCTQDVVGTTDCSELALAYSPPSPTAPPGPLDDAERSSDNEPPSPPDSRLDIVSRTFEGDVDVRPSASIPAKHRERVKTMILALRKWNRRGSLLAFLRNSRIRSAPNLYYKHRQCILETVPGLDQRVYESDVDSEIDSEGPDNGENPVRLPRSIPRRHRPRVRAIVRAFRGWDRRSSFTDFLRKLPIPSATMLYYQHRQIIVELVPGLLQSQTETRKVEGRWNEGADGEDDVPSPATVPQTQASRVRALIRALRHWDKREFVKFIVNLNIPNGLGLYYRHRQCIEERVHSLRGSQEAEADAVPAS